MKKHFFLLLLLTTLSSSAVWAQRQQQTLGRGVVAVQNGSNVLITWRRLAQEPEDATYNVYVRKSGGSYAKLNASPLSLTNYSCTSSQVPVGSEVAVSIIGKDGTETQSEPFTVKTYDLRNIFVDIDFHNSPLTIADYTTKYVWPVDLDGDGEYDYVVDRLHQKDGVTDKLEGYLRTGEHLWTIDMGLNEFICMGQDDQVLAYDMNCDGRGELVIQTSDGTRFWDAEQNDFGAYLLGKEDTDGDGIVDYETQTVRNAPKYMTVVDGMTGKELATTEQTYTDYYNRTNRASLMGDEYNKHVGHMGVFYHDGIHPAVVMEYHTRTTDGAHHYFNGAWAFDFTNGKATNWHQLFNEPTGGATFHQIRVADPDGDGCDEMIEGGYTMDQTGKTLFNTGIAHGDRFRTSDIDPERPGLETFAIQQNAGDMLGQILYDAATGEPIKKWYLSAVGDVGRGECMDLDPDHLGYEMFSTMEGMYDAKGNLISDLPTYFPTEGIWWDGELDRERMDSPDGNGYNADVRKYAKGANTRLFEIAKSSNYKYLCAGSKRALFWGDIIGDWREEVILRKQESEGCTGVTGFSTDLSTSVKNIYCLQEDPAYRMQCTTKGYYQSPNTGFYLGYDMPRPQLPPCMVTDLVCQSTGKYVDFTRGTTLPYTDGKSVLFDLITAENITVDAALQPGTLYAMPVKGQRIALSGSGNIGGTADVWKSQAGTFVLDIPLTTTGTTYISEGTLEVNEEISGKTELRARGTLAGHGAVNEIAFEGALNYEGGRIAPSPTLTFKQGLLINKKVYVEMDLTSDTCDLVVVQGDLTVTAPVVFSFVTPEGNPQPARYKLLTYTGNFEGSMEQMLIRGLQGMYCQLENENHAIWLVVNAQRAATDGVSWTGQTDGTWDYATPNFLLENEVTEFVSGDSVTFDDEALTTAVTVDELMPAGRVTIQNETKDYTFSGEGGISGAATFTKSGAGLLTLSCRNSDYTGGTVFTGGSVKVNELADGGMASSIGAATSAAKNWQMGGTTLIVDNKNASTDRGLTLTDTVTLQIPAGTLSLKGIVTGKGILVKSGAGQLNLTYGGTNTYSGGTVLRAGTLAMGTWNTTFGSATSTITAYGGTISIFDNNSTSATPVFQNTLDIPEGKSVTFVGGKRCKIQGKLTGSGTLKVSFPYVRGDVSTDMKDFAGTLDVTSGQFRLTKATNLSQAAVVLESDAYMVHVKAGSGTEQNLTSKLGSLASTSTTASLGTGTWMIGSDGTSTSYAGTFGSAAQVTKVGEGTWTLTGAVPIGMTVSEGTLQLSSDATLDGTVTVGGAATLDLVGTAKNVTVQTDGTLCINPSRVLAYTGHVSGNLTVSRDGIVSVKRAGKRNDKFQVDGKVTLTSPLIHVDHVRGTYAAGDTLALFENFASLLLTGTATVEPEVPAEGLEWDLSTFGTDGVLRIVNATGIQSMSTTLFTLTPNPTNGICHLTFAQPLRAAGELRIVGMQGEELLRQSLPIGISEQDIDLSALPDGLYLAIVNSGKENQVQKIIKK